MQRLLIPILILSLTLGCSSSNDAAPEQSALMFMSDFVSELDQFAREREERRTLVEGIGDAVEVTPEFIRAALQEIDQIAREAAEHFTARGVFDGNSPRLSFAVSRALCSSVWLRYPEDQGNVVTLLRGESGETCGLQWQTVVVEPLSKYGGERFTLCLVARNGEWSIFTPPYTAEFLTPLHEVGYQSPELLGFGRRWMRGGQLDPNRNDAHSSIMRFAWRGKEEGVFAEWRSQDMGAEDGKQNGGCSPSRITEWLRLTMLPQEEEAVLLCDGALPLSFLKNVLAGLERQSWDVQVLIPGPVEGVVYAIPTRFLLHQPDGVNKNVSAQHNTYLDSDTDTDTDIDSDAVDPLFGSSDFSATLNADGRVVITLAQDIDGHIFSSLVPYMLDLTRR